MNLAFEAGRLAERRGWTSPVVVEPEVLASVVPGPGELIVVASEATFLVQHARDVAALIASGKSVAVVTPVTLTNDVQSWLPDNCAHIPGDSRVQGWSVGDGIATLSWYADEGIESALYDSQLSPEGARALADQMREVEVGIAWDRPIMVPTTAYSSNVLNLEGFSGWLSNGPVIDGLEPREYLKTGATGWLAAMFDTATNPLRFERYDPHTGKWDATSALASLNLSVDGQPVLLVCVPDFIDRQSDGDASTCVVVERDTNGPFARLMENDSQFLQLQARPGTEPPGLEPLPAWLRQSGAPGMSAVIGLFDLWAHGFLSGFYLGGIEWFCRYGKGLDAALRADWNTLITALEARAQE